MRHQELNLLAVFDAIMTEKSITRAADRLAMTQPAVSNAVSRMRVAWNDDLFVKDGRNIQPTLYAQNLWSQIREPLKQLGEAVDPSVFDPSTAKRTYRVAGADIVVDIAWKKLRKIIEREAPNINVYAFPYTIVNGDQSLNDAEVDLVIGGANTMSGSFSSEFLFDAKYVCVMRPGHPLAKPRIGLKEFANADHLLVSLSGDTSGFTDQALIQHGLRRRVAMTVNHFSVVGPLLVESDLIAVVPSTAVEKEIFSGELAVTKPPVNIAPNGLACFWHQRQERDLGLVWFREHLSRIIRESAATHYEKLQNNYCKLQKCS